MPRIPLVSVVLPAYLTGDKSIHRRSVWLEKSITSLLEQDFQDFEIVLVDDGSTGKGAEFVRSFSSLDKVKLITLNKNHGVQKALNVGIGHSHSKLIARQDSDDYSDKRRLMNQVLWMEDHPELSAIGSWAKSIDSAGKVVSEIKTEINWGDIYDTIALGCPMVHGSVMMRRKDLKIVGYYSEKEEVKHVEDYDLWVRMARYGLLLGNIPQFLYYHRRHNLSISRTKRALVDERRKDIQARARTIEF